MTNSRKTGGNKKLMFTDARGVAANGSLTRKTTAWLKHPMPARTVCGKPMDAAKKTTKTFLTKHCWGVVREEGSARGRRRDFVALARLWLTARSLLANPYLAKLSHGDRLTARRLKRVFNGNGCPPAPCAAGAGARLRELSAAKLEPHRQINGGYILR